jgi:predicted dienelactone hydrolase
MKKVLMAFMLLFASGVAMGQSFTTDTFSVFDASRQRSIPCKVYLPNPMNGEYPVVIFSHGLGGTRNAAGYLGQYLAAHGYICVHIQHAGSDEGIWKNVPVAQRKESLKSSLLNPENARNRFEDIPFMVKALGEMNEDNVIVKGHLNMNALGMAGHSYGAVSTMVACGQKLAGTITRFAVPEIKAGLVLSPSTPQRMSRNIDNFYSAISVPIFHMTGTNDGDPLERKNDFDPAERQQPYQNISTSPQYLLVLDGASHFSFGGNESGRFGASDSQRYTDAVNRGALAFFDRYLKGNISQENWLKKEFSKTLLQADKFEYKN